MKGKVFIAIFIIISLAMYPIYRLTYSNWNHENYENRIYTTFDDVISAPINKKSQTFDNFINDNAPFKNEFTSLNSGINLKLFNVIQSSQVLLGSDNWLFLKNDSDSSSIDDFQGLNHYTQEQMDELMQKLVLLNDVLSKKDIEFKVIVPPNKEQVYSRYMPESIVVIDKSRVEVLSDYINSNCNVNFIYPLKQFKELSLDKNIYYKYDTHWNNLGALYGIQMLFDGFDDLSAEVADKAPLMDQARVSGVYNYVKRDDYYKIVGDTEFENKQLYILHDSFGDMLIPILQEKYSVTDATFSYFNSFDLPETTDIFVIEINERYIYRLFDTIDRIIENAENL